MKMKTRMRRKTPLLLLAEGLSEETVEYEDSFEVAASLEIFEIGLKNMP